MILIYKDKILDIGPLGRIGKDGLGLDGGALASAACLLAPILRAGRPSPIVGKVLQCSSDIFL